MTGAAERTTHRGVHWARDDAGNVSFYDESTKRWVRWAPGVDAPPLPPKWQLLGVPTRVTRPGWRSPWRIVPAVLVTAAVVVAIVQSLAPSGNNTAREAKASAALLGHCLPKSSQGFSSTPVACNSPKAAVKVVKVIPSTPGSPLCPAGTRGVELAYPGVRYLHIECVTPVK
ncbi:MAG TPA: hypothetical protein VFN61_04620 [Acidimicrobiales bacterium]|nr:hypothetical protein [Acidimicrobiales bacterium]